MRRLQESGNRCQSIGRKLRNQTDHVTVRKQPVDVGKVLQLKVWIDKLEYTNDLRAHLSVVLPKYVYA